jgi:hypothetical protein
MINYLSSSVNVLTISGVTNKVFMNNLTVKANSSSEIVYVPNIDHLVCLAKRITRETLNNYFVGST